MSGQVRWNGRPLAYLTGESLASALNRAGLRDLGLADTGQPRAVFCGIGQCQGCLVLADGSLTEACLLICHDGLVAQSDRGPAGGGNG